MTKKILITLFIFTIIFTIGCSSNNEKNNVIVDKQKTESENIKDKPTKENKDENDTKNTSDTKENNNENKDETDSKNTLSGSLVPSLNYDKNTKILTFELKNETNIEQTFSFPTTKEYEVIVLDKNKKEVFNSSKNITYENKLTMKTLKIGESFAYKQDLKDIIKEGQYFVTFKLGASDQPIEIPFLIE